MEGNNTDCVVDRISPLPDSILGHILSFLRTDEAVATSILSKRWKLVWVTVHNLDFYYDVDEQSSNSEAAYKIEDKSVADRAENIEFIHFVDRVLLLTDAGPLNKFSLFWNNWIISSHLCSWIKTAITRNVRELHLDLGLGGEIITIPVSGFNCDSLRSLSASDLTLVHDATAVSLPRLESLKLGHVYFTSKEACEKLVSGCPMLHHLSLNIYVSCCDEADDDFMCIISSASLRSVDIDFEERSRLKLKASSLEYLRLHGCISEIFVEKSLSTLVEAEFLISLGNHNHLIEHDFLNNSIVEAVRAFERVKFLTLSTHVMRALSRATISLSTEFTRLVKLHVETYCSSLQDFIQSSANLEALIIDEDSWYENDVPDHSRWTTPVEVPRCLSTSLKKVQLDGYKGLEDEREMIRYMLEHGRALEVMQIRCSYRKGDGKKFGDGEKLELLQEICEFPRKSPACKVQF